MREECSLLAMGADEWENKYFDDDDTTHLCFARKKVNDHNSEIMQKNGNPAALIEAFNEGRTSSFSNDNFGGFDSR